MKTKRYLVLVRAGEHSLHRNWIGDDRNWDLVVSWYGDTPYEPVADETVINIRGGAGDGIYKTFQTLPELLERYDYVWLPDDDIETDCAHINTLFETTSQQQLVLSQPALSHDSYFSHPHTLVSPSFRLRYTTFVEVMAPCLSRAKLKAVLPLFQDHPSLFGVDVIWTRLDPDDRWRVAIIDEAVVRHTRPVGSYLLARLKASGQDPVARMGTLLRGWGAMEQDKSFKCYGGIAKDGRRHGGLRTRVMMISDYLLRRREWRQRKARQTILRMFRRRPAKHLTLAAPAKETLRRLEQAE